MSSPSDVHNITEENLHQAIQAEMLKRSDKELENLSRLVEASTRQALSVEGYTRALEELKSLISHHIEGCHTCRERQSEYLALRKETHGLLERTYNATMQKQTWWEKVIVPLLTALLTSGFLLYLMEKILPTYAVMRSAKP